MTKRAPPFATFNEGGNQNLITNETPQIGELKDFHLIASEADYSGTFTGLLLQCKFSVEENSQDDPRVSAIRFLVACYATLHPALSVRRSFRRSVGLSVRPSHFTFSALMGVLALLLLPKCSTDLNYGPCPPARDWGSRVSGLVQSVRPSIGPSVTLYFFGANGFLGPTAPAHMFH